MKDRKGKVMTKDAFLRNGSYSKEEYEGLLVSADTEQGCYNIGVEIGKNRVLLVDQARDNEVHEKVHRWVACIPDIQRQYESDSHLANYSQT